MIGKTFLFLLGLALLVRSETYVFGDGDDNDVVVNFNLPSCCVDNADPTVYVYPVGLLVNDDGSVISEMIKAAADASVDLINQEFEDNRSGVALTYEVANTFGSVEGVKAAADSLVFDKSIHLGVGPFTCEGVQGITELFAEMPSFECEFMTVAPGVVGTCSDFHDNSDSLFMLSSPDYSLARILSKVANNRNILIVSTFGNSAADSLYAAILDVFGEVYPSMNVRRLRFAQNGPDIPDLISRKLDEDLANFEPGNITVIFEHLNPLELRNIIPLISAKSPRFVRYLTTGFDVPLSSFPADVLQLLASLQLTEVIDGLRPSTRADIVSSYFQSVGVDFNPLTARVYDAFLAIATALTDDAFVEGYAEHAAMMRNKIFIKLMCRVLGASSWLGLDEFGNSMDGIYALRRLQSDGTWVPVNGALELGNWW